LAEPPPSKTKGDPRAAPELPGVPLEVFRSACEQHLDFVWRFAALRGVAAADLEHVVHKVFAVVHGRLVSLEHAEELRISVAGITRNVVRGYLRQVSLHSPLDVGLEPEPLPRNFELGKVDGIEEKTAAELVGLILERMTEPEREVFILCELEGFALADTAEALHVSESTLRERLDDACRIYNALAAELRAQRYWVDREGSVPP
jgi:RNA polymerase sigma factor (sigma-70 family)